jgi:hypothetical protein
LLHQIFVDQSAKRMRGPLNPYPLLQRWIVPKLDPGMKLRSNLSSATSPDRWSLADDQSSGLAANPILKQPRSRRFFI